MRVHAKRPHRRARSLTTSDIARCLSAAFTPIRWPLITAVLGVSIAMGVPVAAGGGEKVFIVNSDDDRRNDGCDATHCNLREAILAANRSGRGGEIRFGLPGLPYRIHPRSALPALEGLVLLDGATQNGTECPAPVVQIDGSMIDPDTPVNGLEVLGDGNSVRGLAITGFSGHGVVVLGEGNLVQCVYSGVDPTGEPAGNGQHGIAVIGGHSSTIGGPVPEDGNLLSANGGQGLYVEDALHTTRQYNAIGVDTSGEPRLPNGNTGLEPIIPPPPPPNGRDPEAIEEITAEYERRLADIAARNRDSLHSAGLFEKYVELLSVRGERVQPADLTELIAALSREPDLYAAFTGEAAAVLADADAVAAAEIDRAGRGFRQSVASLGRDAEPVPEDSGDLLGELLATRAPEDFTVSGEPSTVIAVEGGVPGPITLDPLRWHSLQTYGPQTFNSTVSNSVTPLRVCIGETTVCEWPIAYDFLPGEMELLWQSPTFSAQELSDIVTENGYTLELFVNGIKLLKGPPFGSPSVDPEVAANQGYWAVSWFTEPCPQNNNCLSVAVAARKKLANVPQPWTFTIRIREVTELDTPQIIGIDEFGNPILATHSYETLDETSRVIEPSPVSGGQHWFTEALVDTFYHPRCSDCHGFGTIENLAVHHNLGGDTQSFIAATDAHLEPSAYVPGAHVIACENCHTVPLKDSHGHPFHETDWIAPYQDLDVDWSQKTPAQICARVITNLPTKELRRQHFHGDGRLFWAIENPWVVSHSLDPAPPDDFDEFLRRVDLWNAFGAPCP